MGVEDVRATAALIRRVAAGRTVLMVEHNLGVVADLADHITVLAEGQVLAEGSYADIASDERVRSAYIGKKAHAHA
jgi:branched-chain amino acid transport system ATP-binding protein